MKKKSDFQLDYLVVALGSYSQKLFSENKVFLKGSKNFLVQDLHFHFFLEGIQKKLIMIIKFIEP